MNTCSKVPKGCGAWTLTELFAVILAIMVLLIFFLPDFGRRGVIAGCSSNLKSLGGSFRSWANDHAGKLPMQISTNDGGSMEYIAKGDVFPHFQTLAKELQTPKTLICPADIDRQAVENFAVLDDSRTSYFVGTDASVTNSTLSSTNHGLFLAGDRNLAFDGRGVKPGPFVVSDGESLSWARKIHNRHGNILFEDGHVDFMNTAELKRALLNAGSATNRLAIP